MRWGRAVRAPADTPPIPHDGGAATGKRRRFARAVGSRWRPPCVAGGRRDSAGRRDAATAPLGCPKTQTNTPRASRSWYTIANRFSAAFQSCTGRVHFLATRSRPKYSSFRAASSLGNEPRVLITLRRLMFSDSTALVVVDLI